LTKALASTFDHSSSEDVGFCLITMGSQASMFSSGEYFTSLLEPAARSTVDYLISPIEQISEQLNRWLASEGSASQVQCDYSTWVVAPSHRIPHEYFESYQPFFNAMQLYRECVVRTGGDAELSAPSESQRNAALLGLANLMAALVPAPAPMLLEDGTIGGYWRRGRRYISIDFEVDGRHTWAGTDGERFRSGTWELPGHAMPQMLANELLAITA